MRKSCRVKPRTTAGAVIAALLIAAAPAHAAGPEPGTPEYFQRDNQNMNDAYGRENGPGGQLSNQHYPPALLTYGTDNRPSELAHQTATPTRIAITPGQSYPGWNT